MRHTLLYISWPSLLFPPQTPLCVVVGWGGGGGGGVGVDTQREPLRRREQSLLACSRRLDRGNGANRCGQTPGTGHVTARLGRENV